MDSHPDTPDLHFHIHWIREDELDWECFDTYSEAMRRALELARLDEKFTIDEVPEQCPLRRAKTPLGGEY